MTPNELRTTVDAAAYQAVRNRTEKLAAPLTAEDQMIQSMPDVSPTKWHRAHVTWFFETFLLIPHLPDYRPFDDTFGYLYNSYYELVGDRHPRGERGLVSRPPSAQIAAYREHVDSAMGELFGLGIVDANPDIADLVRLGLNHEQQHQELLLMDIKHVFSVNPTRPAYQARPDVPIVSEPSSPIDWIEFDGGLVEIGHDGKGFHFDNEGPRHTEYLAPYQLADRLVTCGDWLQFMADDGYHDPSNWLSEGWATIAAEGWDAPMYWEPSSSGWRMHTLHGMQPIDLAEPVCHISYYEADAYARWAGARLPTEAEWEHAASSVSDGTSSDAPDPNLAGAGHFHPVAAAPRNDEAGLRQMIGDVWEWTSSSYGPYPGFRPAPGAVGEYNGKFMVNQYVLRGGCCATPNDHIRTTYRNFFPAHSRWMFGGLRLAKDV